MKLNVAFYLLVVVATAAVSCSGSLMSPVLKEASSTTDTAKGNHGNEERFLTEEDLERQDVENYILDLIDKGYAPGEIRAELSDAGYTQDDLIAMYEAEDEETRERLSQAMATAAARTKEGQGLEDEDTIPSFSASDPTDSNRRRLEHDNILRMEANGGHGGNGIGRTSDVEGVKDFLSSLAPADIEDETVEIDPNEVYGKLYQAGYTETDLLATIEALQVEAQEEEDSRRRLRRWRSCAPATSNCFEARDRDGCRHEYCEDLVCALKPECCSDIYDSECAATAEALCKKCDASTSESLDEATPIRQAALNEREGCTLTGSNCFVRDPSRIGCDDEECEVKVCAEQPWCCSSRYGIMCRKKALEVCNQCSQDIEPNLLLDVSAGQGSTTSSSDSLEVGQEEHQCAPMDSNCFTNDPNRIGCDNTYCQEKVCENESFCCDSRWGRICKRQALDVCNTCGSGDENGDGGDNNNEIIVVEEPEIELTDEQKAIAFDDAVNEFYGIIDPFYWLKKFRSAGYHTAKQDICREIRDLPSSRLLSEAAKLIGQTIVMEFITDLTVLLVTGEFGMSISFGENGEFSCAEDYGVGFSLGLLGGGRARSFAVAPSGWKTVGATWDDSLICFSFGYTPLYHGGAVIFTINPKAGVKPGQVAKALDGTVRDAVDRDVVEDLGNNGKTLLHVTEDMDLTEYVPDGVEEEADSVLVNIGFELTQGFDLLDVVEEVFLGGFDLPDVDIVGCIEKLTLCEGPTNDSCKGKNLVQPWEDGHICGLGTTCGRCRNKATWWWGKAFTFCGREPEWSDGTICGLGTTCNACKNRATWWASKFFTACGNEPCWKKGTICGIGTTAKLCCNGAHCPWYWFGFCKCK